jgi:hypothetical protein
MRSKIVLLPKVEKRSTPSALINHNETLYLAVDIFGNSVSSSKTDINVIFSTRQIYSTEQQKFTPFIANCCNCPALKLDC